MAAVIAFGYGLPAGFAIFLLVSVAHASALAPIVPIADAMTLAAAPGRFQYGWVRGGASAAFVVGAVGAGQVIQATSLGGIVWMNGTLLALAAVAALCKRDVTAASHYAAIACEPALVHFQGSSSSIFVLG